MAAAASTLLHIDRAEADLSQLAALVTTRPAAAAVPKAARDGLTEAIEEARDTLVMLRAAVSPNPSPHQWSEIRDV